MDNEFKGDRLELAEMPYGCEIYNPNTKSLIIVSSPVDAIMIINSLLRMLISRKVQIHYYDQEK